MCITSRPVFDALLTLLGPEGFLFSYDDQVYMGGTPVHLAVALSEASGIYAPVGLQLGWGPKNIELVLPLTVIHKTFPSRDTLMATYSRTSCHA